MTATKKTRSKKPIAAVASGKKRSAKTSQAETNSIEKLSRKLGYRFSDLTVLTEAITHRSKHSINNERLEFLGDSILGYVISSELFQRFPNAREGQLTRGRAVLVKGRGNYLCRRKLEAIEQEPALIRDETTAELEARFLAVGWGELSF